MDAGLKHARNNFSRGRCFQRKCPYQVYRVYGVTRGCELSEDAQALLTIKFYKPHYPRNRDEMECMLSLCYGYDFIVATYEIIDSGCENVLIDAAVLYNSKFTKHL